MMTPSLKVQTQMKVVLVTKTSMGLGGSCLNLVTIVYLWHRDFTCILGVGLGPRIPCIGIGVAYIWALRIQVGFL